VTLEQEYLVLLEVQDETQHRSLEVLLELALLEDSLLSNLVDREE